MFSSIKWKFIIVYFLLIFIAMVIIGIFIVGRLEDQQIEAVTKNMEQSIEMLSTSSSIASDDWIENREDIQNTIDEWRIGANETLYVIYNTNTPTIIASSAKSRESLIGQNALSNKFIDPTIVLKALSGEKGESIVEEINEDITNKHLAYPIYSSMGKINGILYMTSDLENVYKTINGSETILTNATFLALIITIFLGFLIASSITEPIRDVTKKAEEMAMGDFDQYVEVKSDDEIGQLASMFNHLTTKLKDTIEDMDLERSKLDTIFNYMAEGVVAVDINGSIIHVNPIAMSILGLTEDVLTKECVLDLKNLNLNNINYERIETLKGTEITSIDSQVFKIKYAPFNDEKNKVGGLIVVFQDITQEHKLDNMRKEFVANVSHELKTPITTIKSYAETLMENDVDKEISQRFLSVIDSESDRMARLVRDLLQLSNIDYKKTNWEKSEISISKMLRDIIQKLDLLIKEKEHEIILNIPENLPNILADKDGIEQVILNIISNAIKYTENNGRIQIMANADDKELTLSVKDNGIGIPKEDQERIFERFYRVEKGRSREMGGTGLGLSIAKEIVEAHNGHIYLESAFKEGTEIIIQLPLV
jgi:two-component system sensor histidine kinase VicK